MSSDPVLGQGWWCMETPLGLLKISPSHWEAAKSCGALFALGPCAEEQFYSREIAFP